MFKTYKFRLYPTDPQKELISKHIGCSRFVYNLALETKITAYLGFGYNFSPFDLSKQIPELKEDCLWLKEVNSQSLQQAIQNMDVAFKRFFKGAGFPRYKSKRKGVQSFSIPQNVMVENGYLIIPKFKKKGIKINMHRKIKGTVKSTTVSRTATGKFFASILVDTHLDTPVKAIIKEDTSIGVDLGIKTFLVTSRGLEIKNPKNLRIAQAKLKYAQRKYSKYKGGRTKKRVSLMHEKVANKRKDFLQKVSTELIDSQDTICLETLNVKGMLKNHNLAASIADASWSTFVSMLEYKAIIKGKNILRIGMFAPSSKCCSKCGSINKELTLKDRTWTCRVCNSVLDRDINASINIKSFALKKHFCKGLTVKNRNELPSLEGVLTFEAYNASNAVL